MYLGGGSGEACPQGRRCTPCCRIDLIQPVERTHQRETIMASKQTITKPQSNRVRLVVASSVMLTFISFWRAAAIVLNDLGSSAFYAGGIAEEAVGKAAPWFILGVMLFSVAGRSVYVGSCSMI